MFFYRCALRQRREGAVCFVGKVKRSALAYMSFAMMAKLSSLVAPYALEKLRKQNFVFNLAKARERNIFIFI